MTCKPSTLEEATKKPPRIEMPSKWNPRLSDLPEMEDLPENETETEEKETTGEAKADSAGNGEVSTKEVVSTVSNKTARKMKWKKAIEKQNHRNGYKPIMTDQGFVRKDLEGGESKKCKDLVKSGPVELVKDPDAKTGDTLSQKVNSTVSKKTVSKMKWKKAIEKQNNRNGYKPIMTDHGFVTKDLKPPQNNKKKENEITKQHVSKCNRLSENSKIDNSACIQNGNADQEKKRESPGRSKEEKESKEEKKLREGELSNGTAQRPSSLNIRSHLRKEQQGRQAGQQQGTQQQQQHNQGTQDDLGKEQQGIQKDLVSRSDHKKEDQDGCPKENEKQSQQPKQSDVVLPAQGWTSWQEMAAKKCPTKNLIVFN